MNDDSVLETRYLKIAIAVPLAAPAIAWAAAGLGLKDPTPTSGFLIGSLLIGGAPYALCAVVALLWLRGRSVKEHRRLAVFAPLIFIPVLTAGIGITESLGRMTWDLRNVGALIAWSAAFSIAFGYFYLALVLLVRPWVVRSRNQA